MFDPYRKWLGIPEGQRPPTHYQLLGIAPDERDVEVINAAVVRQSAYVRNFQTGKYSADATRLLNEIAAAKVCLIDPVKRSRYDAELANDSKAGHARQPSPPPARVAGDAQSPSPAAHTSTEMPPGNGRDGGLRTPRHSQSAPITMPVATRPMRTQSARLTLDAPLLRPRPNKQPLLIRLALGACALVVAVLTVVLISRPQETRDLAQFNPPLSGTLVQAEPSAADKSAERPAPAVASQKTVEPISPVMVASSSTTQEAQAEDEENPFATPAGGSAKTVPPPGDPPAEDEDNPFGTPAESSSKTKSSPSAAPKRTPGTKGMRTNADDVFDRMEAHLKEARAAARKAELGETIGKDTQFVGSDGGGSKRMVEPDGMLYGVDCWPGEWFREKCLGKIEPLFSPNAPRKSRFGAIARDGYAVGAVKVQTINYVNAIQLVFMKIKEDGRLDPDDKYTSDWIGYRGRGKTFSLTGDGTPIIGLHLHQGIIVNALALVVDDDADAAEKEN